MGSPVWGMPTSYSSTLQLTLTLFRGNLASQDSRGIRKGSELNRDCFCQLCSHPKLGFSSAKIEPMVRSRGETCLVERKKLQFPPIFRSSLKPLEWKLRSQIFLNCFISNEKGITRSPSIHCQQCSSSCWSLFSIMNMDWKYFNSFWFKIQLFHLFTGRKVAFALKTFNCISLAWYQRRWKCQGNQNRTKILGKFQFPH